MDAKLQIAADKADYFNREEELFEKDVTNYPLRKQLSEKLAPYLRLYEAGSEFFEKRDLWLNSQVGTHDPETIEDDVMNLFRTVFKLEKTFADNQIILDLVLQIKSDIEVFKEKLPVIQILGNPGLRDRHWAEISEIVGFPIIPGPELTLQKILDMDLEEFLPKLEIISEGASKEYNMEKSLEKMKNEWAEMHFQILPYKETGTYVITSVEEIQLLLDDHIIKTQTMLGTPFVKPFLEEMT